MRRPAHPPASRRTPARAAAAALLAAALPTAALADDAAPEAAVPAFANEVEASLVRAIVGLRENGLRHAIGEIDVALAKTPNFRLGHLIKGDLLMARAGNPVAFGPLTASATRGLAPLQEEARARLQHYLDAPPRDHLPLPVMQLSADQAHAILVDTARSRLFVFANRDGAPRYVTDFYVSVGKNGVEKRREGDQKTPLGVYTIVSSKEKLPDFYGVRRLPDQLPERMGPPARAQRPRHLAARHALGNLQPPAARNRRLRRPHQRGPAPPGALHFRGPYAGRDQRRQSNGRRRIAGRPPATSSSPPSSSGAPTGRASIPTATCRITPRASVPKARTSPPGAPASAR